jgi:hypothetical protein
MRFTSRQHLKMAAKLDQLAKVAKPPARKRLEGLAFAHRLLAKRAAKTIPDASGATSDGKLPVELLTAMPQAAETAKELLDPPVFPEYYVLVYARRYAEVARSLAIVRTEKERRKKKQRLSRIRNGGMIEFERERERRERQFPSDFRKALVEKDGSIISRAISREESEMVRYANAIPPFASLDNLSAIEMFGLADMFEGWAQTGRRDPIDVARLLGWADGFRSLGAEIGADYVPPEPPVVIRPSLLKFMALKMFQ